MQLGKFLNVRTETTSTNAAVYMRDWRREGGKTVSKIFEERHHDVNIGLSNYLLRT